MKKSILASALFLLFSTGVFAATPGNGGNSEDLQKALTINGLRTNIGISVSIAGVVSQKPSISITDMDGNKLYAENISTQIGYVRGYNLSALENGDYMVTINVGKQEVKKQIHIYEDEGKKTYFIMQ